MAKRKTISPKTVLGRIAHSAALDRVFSSMKPPKPGEFLTKRVSKKDRESLKNLKSDDIKSDGFRLK